MKIDIDQINDFFKNYKTSPMPKIVRDLTLEGKKLCSSSEGLEIVVLEARQLAPELLEFSKKNISALERYNIPVLRRGLTYIAYNPNTGERLGDSSKTYSFS